MIESLMIGIGGIVGLMILWMGIQALWGKVFSDYISDEDVLAHRTRCGNCDCTTVCKEDEMQLSFKE